MPAATEGLSAEHRLIGRVLASLGTFVSRLEPDRPEMRQELADYVEFFRKFVEGRHERMEEAVLFTEMSDIGGTAGPVALMIEEHHQRAGRIAEMQELAAGKGPLDAVEVARLTEAVAAYSTQLRAHILKEDRTLFPMAEALLAGERLEEIAAGLADFAGKSENGRNLLALAERLMERYPPVG